MKRIIDLFAGLIEHEAKIAKDQAINEVRKTGYIMETHVKAGILGAIEQATMPVLAICVSAAFLTIAVGMLLYGIARTLGDFLLYDGLGFIATGVFALIVSWTVVDSSSRRLRNELASKTVMEAD